MRACLHVVYQCVHFVRSLEGIRSRCTPAAEANYGIERMFVTYPTVSRASGLVGWLGSLLNVVLHTCAAKASRDARRIHVLRACTFAFVACTAGSYISPSIPSSFFQTGQWSHVRSPEVM